MAISVATRKSLGQVVLGKRRYNSGYTFALRNARGTEKHHGSFRDRSCCHPRRHLHRRGPDPGLQVQRRV